jgi:hypothetical protein
VSALRLRKLQFSKRFGHLDNGEDIGGIVAALAERLDYVSHIGIYPFLHPILWKLIMALTFITNKVDSTYVFAEQQIADHQRRELEEGKSSESPDMLDRFMKAHRADPNHFTKNDVLIGGYSSIVAGKSWVFRCLYDSPIDMSSKVPTRPNMDSRQQFTICTSIRRHCASFDLR